MNKTKCHRTISWLGKVEEIVVDKHTFAWSGKIPCTGEKRCIYCGEYEFNKKGK